MTLRVFGASALFVLGSVAALTAGCSSDAGIPSNPSQGSIGLSLQLASGATLSSVSYTIVGPNGFARAGSIDTSHSAVIASTIGGIPAGHGFSITLDGTTTDGGSHCAGSANFDVTAQATTTVSVHLACKEPAHTGSVLVNGSVNVCPSVDGISASPAEVLVGSSLALAASAHDSDALPSPLAYHWTATAGGSLGNADVPNPTLTCTKAGSVTVSVTTTDGDCTDTLSTTVTCTGSGGTGFSTMDLSRYVRVARYLLPEPTRTTPPDGTSLLAQEASAVTYDWDTDTLFVVGDGGTSIVQVTKTGALIDSMTLAPGSSPQGTEFYDTEGVAYVGGGKFVLNEERYRQVNLLTYVPGATLHRSDVQTVKLGTTIGNIGLEGVTYEPPTGKFIFVKEKEPESIFETAIDFAAGTATNGSPTADESTNLFDPSRLNTLDFSDVFALSNLPSLAGDPTFDQLLVISQESGELVQVDRSGNVKHTLTLVADAGDTISVPDMTNEGVTMDRDGNLYVVDEDGGGDANHPQLWVYAPSSAANQAPTAVSLKGAVTSLPENTNTTAAVKLADIAVTDDGLGDNTLSLAGADAGSFELIGTALFLKAGVTLSAATQASYHVTVNVDDTTVGATPDASTAYTLAISAVTGGGPVVLAITEAAPWSSGNSPLAADWFELTNLGTSSVSLVGWTMDDNSNSFAVSVPLNGISSIAPGESVIFIETTSSADLAAKAQAFKSLWFGSVAPASLQIGSYSGSGVGLSTGGDAINLFDNGGTLHAAVSFGAASSGPFQTFDNSAGDNNVVLSTLSVAGQNGAFAAAADAAEIGSPGVVGSGSSGGGTPIVNVTAVDALASEAGSDPGVFRFSRSGSTTSALSVVYSVAMGAGQATAGDYTPALSGSQVIPAGAASIDVTITPVDDTTVESSETVTLTLSDTGSYDVGTSATATVTIQDNDGVVSAPPSLAITEVAPWSSSNSPLAADWFEVTNTGSTAVNLTGFKMDDNSHSFANAVALSGVTSIAAGESVIFIETSDPNVVANFKTLWFGANAQSLPQVGSYSGSGVGLSSSADEVTLWDGTGNLITGVGFGASPSAAPFATFDNHAGAGASLLPLPVLSTLSATGVSGAFTASGDANEVGSPGRTH